MLKGKYNEISNEERMANEKFLVDNADVYGLTQQRTRLTTSDWPVFAVSLIILAGLVIGVLV